MRSKRRLLIQCISILFVLFLLPGLCYGAISNAKPIDLNTPVIGSLPKRDTKNYYTFTLPSDGYIRLDFEHENLTENHRGWRIKLLSEDSKELEYFSSRWNQPEVSSANIGLPQGRYYVLVYQEYDVHNSADYSLTVNYTASDFWEKEPNETILTASEIMLNQVYMGSLNRRNDNDYYTFTLPSDGYIRLDFEHENLTESHRGWRIKVLSEDSKELEYFSSRWNQPEVSSANIGLPQGRYYVLVYQEYDVHNSADYSLTVNYTASDFWEKEPNDTILTASEVVLNQAYTGSLNSRNDKDYYTFNFPSDGYIRIDFKHENLTQETTGWSISLIDAESKAIESFKAYWNITDTSSANINLTGGRYFVLVESGNSHSNIDYNLTVKQVDYEQDDTEEIAAEVDSEEQGDQLDEAFAEEVASDSGSEQVFALSRQTIFIAGAVVIAIILIAVMMVNLRRD